MSIIDQKTLKPGYRLNLTPKISNTSQLDYTSYTTDGEGKIEPTILHDVVIMNIAPLTSAAQGFFFQAGNTAANYFNIRENIIDVNQGWPNAYMYSSFKLTIAAKCTNANLYAARTQIFAGTWSNASATSYGTLDYTSVFVSTTQGNTYNPFPSVGIPLGNALYPLNSSLTYQGLYGLLNYTNANSGIPLRMVTKFRLELL